LHIGRENSNLLKASYGLPFSGGEPLNGHFSDTSTQKWKIALKKKEFPSSFSNANSSSLPV